MTGLCSLLRFVNVFSPTMPLLMKNLLIVTLILFFSSCGMMDHGQTSATPTNEPFKRPKLIIGVVVDQMKSEYLSKYWGDFGETGFRRLINEGFSASNLHYNYMPTLTGPGHASIHTGTTPEFHGIVANDWYVRTSDQIQYCAKDTAVRGVGSSLAAAQMSPVHMRSTTLGDELRIFSNMRSKVIGVSAKDRGSILPAGRLANAAYWYIGGQEDIWATSSWYGMSELPGWVKEFNDRKLGSEYLAKGWSLMKPESSYDESMEDNNPYEAPFRGTTRPVFPYDLEELRSANGNYDLVKGTPWGNTMTADFAKAAIQGESLGKGAFTDMLCLSFSSTDYIGHQFGIHSRETQDCYIRLDQDLGVLLSFLDEWVGKGEYLLFLTGDHGAPPTPSYMKSLNGGAEYFKSQVLEDKVEAYLVAKYGEGDWVINESNQNIFLNHQLVIERKLALAVLQNEVAQMILTIPGVAESFSAENLRGSSYLTGMGAKVQLGFNQVLSGDVVYTIQPGWLEYGMTGTHHGAPYNYDTHVPALFFGFGVEHGESWNKQSICDIVPSVAAICHIPLPNAAIGEPIKPLVK